MPSFHHIENVYLKNALDEMKSQMMYLISMNENKSEDTTDTTDDDSSASDAATEVEKHKKRRMTRRQASKKASQKVKGKKPMKNVHEPKNVRSFWNPFSKFPQVDNQDNQSLASSFVLLDDPSNKQSTSQQASETPGGSRGGGADPVPPDPPTPVKTTYWLTKCQLELNSSPLDQVIILLQTLFTKSFYLKYNEGIFFL